MEHLESYFRPFREQIVGVHSTFESPFGKQPLVYADWIASGRLYGPIEDKIKNLFGPMVGNTHSEASETGVTMTHAYHEAQQIIKRHVNADANDVMLSVGTGMTGAINKFQRILGLRMPEQAKNYCYATNDKGKSYCQSLPEEECPVVFVTHLEHHSNHTNWLESIAEVVVLEPSENMDVMPDELRKKIKKYAHRKLKLGSFSAASNVTGVQPPYRELARIMHEHGGYCFVDFAASAPYVAIDMHPADPMERLDAIFFSPHKFLGGPGSSGIVIFNRELYKNEIPDQPGGGTVEWTDRWGRKRYIDDIETREDGGTPGFLQTIRVALSISLKEQMGVANIQRRENELIPKAFDGLRAIPGLHILLDDHEDRLGVFSFYNEDVHHNLMVKLLNDRYGIQVRGGCSCAGTYGHYLLNVTKEMSESITRKINLGDSSGKPGWVRLSVHPTMTNDELDYILKAIGEVSGHADEWQKDYWHDKTTNEWFHKDHKRLQPNDFKHWFDFK